MATAEISVTVVGDQTHLSTPYNASLPAMAKRLGGRWNPERRNWVFDARDEQRVRELAIEVFGTDGTAGEMVTVRIDLSKVDTEHKGEIIVAGRTAVEKETRDREPRLSKGVVLISGSFYTKSGSMRYPTIGETDAVIEVRDVPKGYAEERAQSDESFTIVDEQGPSRAALEAEAARLKARLSEIETLLASLPEDPPTREELSCSDEVCFCMGMELWQPCENLASRPSSSPELTHWGDQFD